MVIIFQAKAKFAEDKANLDAVKEDTPKVKELAAGLKKTYQSKDGQEEAPLQDKEVRRTNFFCAFNWF